MERTVKGTGRGRYVWGNENGDICVGKKIGIDMGEWNMGRYVCMGTGEQGE
jgi:hypothetical protein